MSEKIRDLGEKKLLDRLFKKIGMKKTRYLAKFDDVFLLDLGTEQKIVINTDMLVGKTDVPAQMNMIEVGRKAVIMASSDLAVKGVIPKSLVCSMALPGAMIVDEFDNLIEGIYETSKQFGIAYIGGDLNEADDIIVDITVIGNFHDSLVSREGILPGQLVAVTGPFGYTRAGLHLLLDHEATRNVKIYQKAIDSVLQPDFDIKQIIEMANQNGIVASIDSSDGLASSLFDLMDVNEIGFKIDSLPVESDIISFSEEHEIDLKDLLFNGGEEYHGIFIIQEELWESIKSFSNEHGYYLERIGTTQKERNIRFIDGNGREVLVNRRGFEHFKKI